MVDILCMLIGNGTLKPHVIVLSKGKGMRERSWGWISLRHIVSLYGNVTMNPCTTDIY
jgi:hypothetical protein